MEALEKLHDVTDINETSLDRSEKKGSAGMIIIEALLNMEYNWISSFSCEVM